MKQKMNQYSDWLLERFPLSDLWNEHMAHYYAPKNFNIWYFFGSLALFVLVNQFVTGILLTMNYKPDAKLAFDSVEYIMRDVNWGWLVRYMHSTGARRSSSWSICTCSAAWFTARSSNRAN